MCDRVGVLAHGRLVAQGPPAKLRSSGDLVRVEVDDPARARRVIESLDGLAVDEDGASARAASGPGALRVRLSGSMTSASVNAALVSAGIAVSALVPEHRSLEDVFMALVEGADVPR